MTLREIADISGGVTKGQRRRPHESVRTVPYLRVANVQRGYLDLKEVKEIEASEREIEALRLHPGDILFNEGGDRDKLGRGWVWNGELPECIHQNHVFRARLRNPEDCPKFISYYGNSEGQRYFMAQGKQTTNLASINLTKLGQLPIPLPSSDQQRRIVAEIEKQFTQLNTAVTALRSVQANLKRYRASVLNAACEGRLVPTEAELARAEGRTSESGDVLLYSILSERRKNWRGKANYKEPVRLEKADLLVLPQGWTWTSLESLLREQLRNGHSAKASSTRTGLRVFTLSAVTEGDFSERNTKLSVATEKKVAGLWAEPGDIYVERSNTPELVGMARLYNGPANFAFIPDLLIRVRVSAMISARYVEICLQSDRSRRFFQLRAQGISGTMPKIDQEAVESLPVPLPPLIEQRRIVAEVERRMSVLDDAEAMVLAGLKRGLSLKQSILQKALKGKL